MKKLFALLVLFSIITLFYSCNKPDPIEDCSIIKMDIKFIDSLGNDATGDSINLPLIRFNKDSIRCQIVSSFDTTNFNVLEINKVGFYNEYTLKYYFGRKYGLYHIVFKFNEFEKDTISVQVIDKYKLEYYFKNELIKLEDGNCGYLNYSIIK